MNAEVSAGWRERIVARARRGCEYCRAPLFLVAAVTTFHVEHIMPRSRGGQTVESNLAFSCPNYNLHKAARITAVDPETAEEVPLLTENGVRPLFRIFKKATPTVGFSFNLGHAASAVAVRGLAQRQSQCPQYHPLHCL